VYHILSLLIAIDPVTGCHFLIMKARVQSYCSLFWIYCKQCTGAGFFRYLHFLLVVIILSVFHSPQYLWWAKTACYDLRSLLL